MSDSPNAPIGLEDQIGTAVFRSDSERLLDETLLDENSSAITSKSPTKGCQLEVGFRTYAISQLTQYGFLAEGALPEEDSGFIFPGNLQLAGEEPMKIEFRVRRHEEDSAKCTFCNMSLEQKKRILQLLETLKRPATKEDGLTSLSYDQLASGNSLSGAAAETKKPVGAKKSAKTFAVLALGLGMIVILGLAFAFMHMQYSLAVTNAALVGNYLPINTRIDGEIAAVYFAEGDMVTQGDLLLRLTNPLIESAAAMRRAELEAAQVKVDALKQQIDGFQTMIEVVSGILDLELEKNQAELIQAEQNLAIASAEVKRFTPYVKTGVITQVDFDASHSTELAWQADCAAKRAKIKQVELSLQAAENNLFVLGDRIDDPQSQLIADLKIAEAEVKRLKVELYHSEQQIKQLDIVAPRDGKIYANYRQVGEYLKPAEEALAISFAGRTWAMGQISASQVSKVRPGQMVHVKIPSLDIRTTGTVAAVGHRAVYAKGGYTADFRSGVATDVPIKVTLDELPADVPSGIRLDMVVKLELGIPWLDEYLGNTPHPTKIVASPRSSTSSSDSETLVSKAAH